MTNLDHIMPKPVLIPILWGHDYATNPTTIENVQKMLSDLVTGQFMNGMAQYGVQRGSVDAPIIIDDPTPPKTIVYRDSSNNLQDDVTRKLLEWVKAGRIPPPPPSNNQMYLVIPPPESTFQTYNTAGDPVGNGVQGFHNEGITNPSVSPTYYWGIVKTDFVNTWGLGDVSSLNFVSEGISPTICHELAEQFVDRNGTYMEIGDNCVNNQFQYRGWTVQQYTSVWDGTTCVNGDNPVSMRRFLQAIGADPKKGLLALGTPIINVDYIALTMQSFET